MENKKLFLFLIVLMFSFTLVSSSVVQTQDIINWSIESISGTEKIFFENNITFKNNKICLTPNSMNPISVQEEIINVNELGLEVSVNSTKDYNISDYKKLYFYHYYTGEIIKDVDLNFNENHKIECIELNPSESLYYKIGNESIILSGLFSFHSFYNNSRAESNFSHITINSSAPYHTLLAYYPFDINHTSDANNLTTDFSSNNYDATISIGNPVWNSTGGRYGAGYTMDNDLISFPSGLDTQDLTRFTGMFWMRPDDLTTVTFFGTTSANTNRLTVVNQTRITYQENSASQLTLDLNQTMNLSAWQHFAFKDDANNNITVYLNGVPVSTTIPAFSSNMRFRGFGRISVGQGFNGEVDEIMIFNTDLNDSQILDIYNNQSARYNNIGELNFPSINLNQTQNNNTIRINLTDNQRLFNTNISARLEYWNLTYGYNNTDDKLIGYYHFDNSPLDSSGNNNHAVINGTPTNESGVFNGSYGFDNGILSASAETNDNLTISNISDFNTNYNITISLWLNVTPSDLYLTDNNIISFQNSTGGFNVNLFDGTIPAIATVFGDYVTSGNPITTSVKNHVVLRMNKNELSFFTNGVELSAGESIESFGNSTGSSIIIGNTFNGYIDELMIYNRSLSNEEIIDLFTRGKAKWNQTNYTNISNNHWNFTISNYTTNIRMDIRMIANNTKFYTPLIIGDIIIDQFALYGQAPPTNVLLIDLDSDLGYISILILLVLATLLLIMDTKVYSGILYSLSAIILWLSGFNFIISLMLLALGLVLIANYKT